MARARPLLLATILLAAALAAGCSSAPVGVAPHAEDQMAVSRGHWNVTAGERTSVPVLLAGPSSQTGGFVRITADDVAGEVIVLPGNQTSRVVWVPVDVEADAPEGVRYLKAEWLSADERLLRAMPDAGQLRVMAPGGKGFGAGDAALLIYTAFTEDGHVFSTNDALFRDWPLPAEGPLGPVQSRGFLLVEVFADAHDGHGHAHAHGDADSHDDDAPPAWAREVHQMPGLLDGIAGMRTGDSRTFAVEPAEGFGERTVRVQLPRIESVPRVHEMAIGSEFIDPASFADHLQRTGQGDAADYEEGDVFFVERRGEAWTYRIVSMDETTVEHRLAPDVGDRHTLHPQWPGQSIVTDFNETRIVFVTTPEHDAPFTMHAGWPDMSSVASIDEDVILVRHDVPLGHVYLDAPHGGPLREHRVYARSDDALSVSSASPNPLSGERIVFHVIMVRHAAGGAGHTTHGHAH